MLIVTTLEGESRSNVRAANANHHRGVRCHWDCGQWEGEQFDVALQQEKRNSRRVGMHKCATREERVVKEVPQDEVLWIIRGEIRRLGVREDSRSDHGGGEAEGKRKLRPPRRTNDKKNKDELWWHKGTDEQKR